MEEKNNFYQRNANTSSGKDVYRYHAWYFVNKYLFTPSPVIMKNWRIFLLRLFGAKIGKGCYISPSAYITRPWELIMGNASSIDDRCYITPPLKIGDQVAISNNCHIIAGSHDVKSRGFELIFNPIEIKDGAFIGCGCYINAGVKIGVASVISAHMNVLKSVPDNKIVVPDVIKPIKIDRMDPEDFEKYTFKID